MTARARVLLLDDSEQVHDRVRRAFEHAPVTVTATGSLAQVQADVLSATPPDLLILDLEMPILSGSLVGRALKRRAAIPIVLYSSESTERLREMVDFIGAEAAVSKSAPDQELVDTVLRVLRSRPAGASCASGGGRS
ncbi:MAG TPA: response regulator [Thermodesulfobacteriota bacterium]|nr:response regulator [Thermodesulfobacteriota bacterium]